MKFTPKKLIEAGAVLFLLGLSVISLVTTINIAHATKETVSKAEAISTMFRANQAALHYAGSGEAPSKAEMQTLSNSSLNTELKRKLALGNQEKLLRIRTAELALLSDAPVDNALAAEWMSALQMQASGSMFKSDIDMQPMIAPALVFTNPMWLLSIAVLLLSAMIIGFGLGRMNSQVPIFSVANMDYVTRSSARESGSGSSDSAK